MSSTAPFPGAPINTEPINTMATLSSHPNTSHSSASTIPAVAPLGSAGPLSVSSLQAPSSVGPRSVGPRSVGPRSVGPRSVGPRSVAPEEARAGSSASNPGEPELGDPLLSTASTSAEGTSCTDTTTTAAVASTSTGAVTTTTNSTGTIATGRISPPQPTQSLFLDTINKCNNCLFLIRKLRNKQEKVSNTFMNYAESSGVYLFAALQAYRDFSSLMKEVLNMFDKLDSYSRRLPKTVPPIESINIMRTLYTQEHTMNHTDITDLLEKMIDSGNWNEGNYQVFYYLSELLRMNPQRKRIVVLNRKPLPPPKHASTATTGHSAFENAYKAARKEIVNKSLGIYPRTLLRTNTSLVIEFQFGCGGTKIVTDSDVVYTMKFLLVEKYGNVDFINMVSTHEDWDVTNNYGITTVNAFKPSRYEVYRRLTRIANRHLLNCFGSNVNRWTAHTLIQFVSLFGKFREVFTTKCRSCKKILKNFLPPLNFDIRTPTHAYHDTCR